MGNRKSQAGFTLLELLIVIGIIAILSTLVGIAINKARQGADKFKLAAQLQTIGVALDAYKADFDSYPVTTPTLGPVTPTTDPRYRIDREGLRGARLLCKALMGTTGGQSGAIGAAGSTYDLDRPNQDGKPGLGFIVVGRSGVATIKDGTTGEMNGKVHGPYLAEGRFKIANTATEDGTIAGVAYKAGDVLPDKVFDDSAVLLDGNDKPILYFPLLNAQAPIGLAFGHVSAGRADRVRDTGTAETNRTATTLPPGVASHTATPMYNGLDNSVWLPTDVFRVLMGDANGDGAINGAESARARGKYVLWTTGPDGLFGPREPDGSLTPASVAGYTRINELAAKGYDDVTNFQGE